MAKKLIVSFQLIFQLVLFVLFYLQHVIAIIHNCSQYNCSMAMEISNPSGSPSSYLQLTSTTNTTMTFNFNITLSGSGGYICLDLGSCSTNIGSSSNLITNIQSYNSNHSSSDLAIGFYGTGQSFGSYMPCSCGSTLIGTWASAYNQYSTTSIQATQAFNPTLSSGFSAICLINACGAGTCTDSNLFVGSLSISNTICAYPSNAPTTSPNLYPTNTPTSASPTFIQTIPPTATPSLLYSSGIILFYII